MTDFHPAGSSGFPVADEASWLDAVEKALKGGGLDRITRQTRDGIAIRPLYREPDFASRDDPRGVPGEAPYLRGARPDPHRPWDIRQTFTHPDPVSTNAEILRDLDRGVSSVELRVDGTGQTGGQLNRQVDIEAALAGVRADYATIALDTRTDGPGTRAAAMLAVWGEAQDDPKAQLFSFNIDPIGCLMRTGQIAGGLASTMARTAALTDALALRFPKATVLRVDARPVHEAGGTEAQELAVLMAHAVDTLRRIHACGLALDRIAPQLLFTLSLDANYGLGIAKLRAARRLWARIQDTLNIPVRPMRLQAVTSSRMLTRFDPWVNMLRNTAACFAGAVGGADIITVQGFNASLGRPEELGRRVARNTQLIAMEESGLGRIADPSGGAWFTETLSEDLARAAWTAFQQIEGEGGLVDSLQSGRLQARIAAARHRLESDIAHRRAPITGISEFPLLDGYDAPVGVSVRPRPDSTIEDAALKALLPGIIPGEDPPARADVLPRIRLAAPFEALRDRVDDATRTSGARPSVFLATLGPLAEHTARLDFARNAFAVGGLGAVEAAADARMADALATAFRDSTCRIAVLCGSDRRYETEAAAVAQALKAAGAETVWIAGRYQAEPIDRQIYMGCDLLQELTVALCDAGVPT